MSVFPEMGKKCKNGKYGLGGIDLVHLTGITPRLAARIGVTCYDL
jgi:hypothetical protein